jgi:hypothetical protein
MANRLRLVSSKVALSRHRAGRGTLSAKSCQRRFVIPRPTRDDVLQKGAALNSEA